MEKSRWPELTSWLNSETVTLEGREILITPADFAVSFLEYLKVSRRQFRVTNFDSRDKTADLESAQVTSESSNSQSFAESYEDTLNVMFNSWQRIQWDSSSIVATTEFLSAVYSEIFKAKLIVDWIRELNFIRDLLEIEPLDYTSGCDLGHQTRCSKKWNIFNSQEGWALFTSTFIKENDYLILCLDEKSIPWESLEVQLKECLSNVVKKWTIQIEDAPFYRPPISPSHYWHKLKSKFIFSLLQVPQSLPDLQEISSSLSPPNDVPHLLFDCLLNRVNLKKHVHSIDEDVERNGLEKLVLLAKMNSSLRDELSHLLINILDLTLDRFIEMNRVEVIPFSLRLELLLTINVSNVLGECLGLVCYQNPLCSEESPQENIVAKITGLVEKAIAYGSLVIIVPFLVGFVASLDPQAVQIPWVKNLWLFLMTLHSNLSPKVKNSSDSECCFVVFRSDDTGCVSSRYETSLGPATTIFLSLILTQLFSTLTEEEIVLLKKEVANASVKQESPKLSRNQREDPLLTFKLLSLLDVLQFVPNRKKLIGNLSLYISKISSEAHCTVDARLKEIQLFVHREAGGSLAFLKLSTPEIDQEICSESRTLTGKIHREKTLSHERNDDENQPVRTSSLCDSTVSGLVEIHSIIWDTFLTPKESPRVITDTQLTSLVDSLCNFPIHDEIYFLTWDLLWTVVFHLPNLVTERFIEKIFRIWSGSVLKYNELKAICPLVLTGAVRCEGSPHKIVIWENIASIVTALAIQGKLTLEELEAELLAILQITWSSTALNVIQRIAVEVDQKLSKKSSTADDLCEFILLLQWFHESLLDMLHDELL